MSTRLVGMKSHTHLKAKATTRVSTHQITFELKHRVLLALNKLADRDTYQIGAEELEKTAECLTPEGFAPFLSCILDTDSEQKLAVRKECIRMMGMLVSFHEGLIGPHLGKMVASIVKRLKDQDSIVRDACVETVGVLALRLGNHEGETCESDGVFVVLVKPLFEALGEQNRQVQSGSALCLARIINNIHDPPISTLQRMLVRTIKLLKNPRFMAKPAVIELNRTIIQAGGAPTQNVLSAAMTSIQEALKSNDWTTRKAASVALGEMGSSGGAFLGSFKTSCICSLESCRFDKVKPVRDTVLQALHHWRSLSGADSPEPSEAGSSIKENYCSDYGNFISAVDSGGKDVKLKKLGKDSIKQRVPLSDRKSCQSYVEKPRRSKADDWQIEIAVPKAHNITLEDTHNEESEGSSVTKTLERMSTVTSMQDTGYEYVPMDDKQECSSVSNQVTNSIATQLVTVSPDCLEESGMVKSMGVNRRFAAEEFNSGEQLYSEKTRDRRSLDSTVTESSSQTARGCCLQTANEMVSIRKQLLEIETKQSNLMDLLQMFTTTTMDSLSMIQSKVFSLEHVVEKIAQDLVPGGRYSDSTSSKLPKKSQSFTSPRLSTCTPRPSVDIRNRPSPLSSMENAEFWEEKAIGRGRSSNSAKQDIEMWTDLTGKVTRNPVGKGIQKNSEVGLQSRNCGQIRKTGTVSVLASNTQVGQNGSESKNSLWKRVKGFVFEGDLDSAYAEALCSGDELVLIGLLDRTGPALESLSRTTASDLLSTLASYFLERRYVNSIIPWLQQVVNLSTIHGQSFLVLSLKARREFLSAIQEAVNMDFSNPAERKSVAQLAMKLHQIWGKSL